MYELHIGECVKDVKGFEGSYAITDCGRVWSYKRNKWLKPFITGTGYLTVRLSIDGNEIDRKIHRLVGEAFIPNKQNKKQINHKNGNKQDNMASNLCWSTARENIQHACDMGLTPHHKLSLKDKIIICKMYFQGKIRQVDIARIFNMSSPGILYITREYGDQVVHA